MLFPLVTELRRAGVAADLAYGGKGLKGAMKAADRSGARFALILGERDLAARPSSSRTWRPVSRPRCRWPSVVDCLEGESAVIRTHDAGSLRRGARRHQP